MKSAAAGTHVPSRAQHFKQILCHPSMLPVLQGQLEFEEGTGEPQVLTGRLGSQENETQRWRSDRLRHTRVSTLALIGQT